MSQPSKKRAQSNNTILQAGSIPARRHRLQNLFDQHGNQFLKWNFLPFLNYEERKSLRISCKILKRFIPPPKFVYFKTQTTLEQYRATARLDKKTGYVETRGYEQFGGNSQTVAEDLQSNVIQIVSTNRAFAALKKNGKVVTWGDYGGDSSSVASHLQSHVVQLFATHFAFAALNKRGKIVAWGYPLAGGDSSAVASDLESDVTNVVGNRAAFAALKSNGKVISWGSNIYGGNSSHLSSLNHGVTKIDIQDSGRGFRATKNDGSVVEWP